VLACHADVPRPTLFSGGLIADGLLGGQDDPDLGGCTMLVVNVGLWLHLDFGAVGGGTRGNCNLVEAIGDSVHVPDQITLGKPLSRFLDRMLVALGVVFPLGATCLKLDLTCGTGGRCRCLGAVVIGKW
jgi:hypothetical protein